MLEAPVCYVPAQQMFRGLRLVRVDHRDFREQPNAGSKHEISEYVCQAREVR